MNIVYYNDSNFMQSDVYKRYLNDNSTFGFLNIRAYAANAAIPISGLNVTVSKIIDNMKVIFFEGATDESGIISSISLPTPINSSDDLVIPLSQDYDIESVYNDQKLLFKVRIYSNIQVNQNINVVPSIKLGGISYGS